jgi:4-hydroxybenzoate polyprenyltransferase
MAIMIMAWVYNDLGAANENFHLRNLANALGIAAFNAGSAIVVTGSASRLNGKGYIWLIVLGTAICSTISILDMPDIAGDSARGRRTMPIVYGHEVARWGLAIPIMLWSVVCPVFLGTGFAGLVFSVFLGSILACHLLIFRTHAADKASEKMWCVWTMALYCLPLFANGDVFVRFWEGMRQL